MLLLTASEDDELTQKGGSVVLCLCAGPVGKLIEHAGHAYQDRLRGRTDDAADNSGRSEDAASMEEDEEEDEDSTAWKLKKLAGHQTEDLYELLELHDLRWRATEDQIKKAFRKMSLKYHPDKVGAANDEETTIVEERFKKIIKAYDTLSDRKQRASYDSVDDVDDSIPSERSINPENFYEELGRVFEMNARWSTAKRVPKLGDDKTSMKEVDKFYDFWFTFKSWREFTYNQEYDPDQAECREERRWMERQNAKKAKSAKLEESIRIRTLSEMAYKLDPRVRRRKEEDRQAKENAKEERRRKRQEVLDAKRAEEEQLQREASEKEAREKEALAEERRKREKLKKQKAKSRQRIRAATGDLTDASIDLAALVEKLCTELSLEALEQLADALGRCDSTDRETLLADEAERLEDQKRQDMTARENQRNSESMANGTGHGKKTTPWTQEEKSMLAKALAKFPGGTRDRWTRISEVVQTRTPQECLATVNEMRQKSNRAAMAAKEAGDRREAAGKPAVTPSKTRAAAPPADEGGRPPNQMNFSNKQQAALEAAMKKFGANLGAERWSQVATAVDGRTPQECEARYKELVTYFKRSKAKK